jgi:outer membrane protein TolC
MIAGARSDATIQEKQLYLTRQTTVLGVVEAYYQAVLAREQVKVQEHALTIAEESADAARKRADAGLIRGLDVSRAELQVARTHDQLNLQQQAASAAMDRLMSAIGAGIGEEPELIDGVPEPPTDLPGLAEAVKIALSNRTEFAIYDEQLSSQARRVEIVKDQFRPKLDVVAGFSSSNNNSGIISRSLIDMGNLTAGLEYRIPLDKRISVENQKVATRDLDILSKLRTYQMEEVTQQIRDAYRRLETSKTTLGILSSNVKVAEDNLKLAQRMVDEGIDDNLVVLDAQDSLTQVESGLLSAKIDLYLAAINLKYAMGQDLTYMGSK